MVSTAALVSSGPRQFRSSASSPWAKSSTSPDPRADEVAAVLAQHVEDVGVRVPAQRAPDDLVDVVVAAFGVGEEADRLVGERMENRRLVARPRIDDSRPSVSA